MRKNVADRRLVAGVTVLTALLCAGILAPAYAHHSFAIRPESDEDAHRAAHALHSGRESCAADFRGARARRDATDRQGRKPVQWGVETGSAAAMARRGISPKTFPDGTVFTVTFFPLRDGRPLAP